SATLNQIAPFHVVEEECLRLRSAFEFHRATRVKAVGVEAQLWHLVLCAVRVESWREVVPSIECIISSEPPARCMESPRTGLEHRRHGCRRGESVLCTVVRRQLPKLSNRVDRRHDDRAGATAIGSFCSVDLEEVVRHALAVERYVLVATHRRWYLEISLQAARAWRQIDDGVEAATIRLELGNLLAGNQAADLAAFGLDHNGSGFDGDRRLGRANFETEVCSPAITHVQNESGSVGSTEA